MRVYAPLELSPIKSGWAARCPILHLAAHGVSQEIATINLTRTVARFLAPFQRTGTLMSEIAALGLRTDDDDGGDLIVVVA